MSCGQLAVSDIINLEGMVKRKNRALIGFCSFLLMSLLWLSAGGAVQAQDAGGHWLLVDTEVKESNDKFDGCRREISLLGYEEGVYYGLFEASDECQKDNEHWPTLWASSVGWSVPPKEISAGQEVTLNIRMALVYQYSSEQPENFVEVTLTGGDGTTLTTILKKTAFNVKKYQEWESQEVRFTAPALKDLPKSASSRIKIVFQTRAGQVGFVYEWVEGEAVEPDEEEVDKTKEKTDDGEVVDEEETVEEEDEELREEIVAEPTSTPKKSISPPPKYELDCSGMNMDSGTRFSDISGNVDVAPCDDPEDYDVADRNMKLYVNDHIRTGRDSTAILSFTDMTTFIMRPESIIILASPPQSDSKLRLVWGQVMVNVKKMLKDGSMEITMNQAVAGIKGTIIVAEETGSESRIKVVEGTVEFTDTATGRTLELKEGETVAASEEGLGRVEEFDVAREKKAWKEYESGDKELSDYCLLDKLIGLFAVVGFLQLRRKTRRALQEYD